MVQGIIIPADNTAPLRTDALDSLEDFQRAVGGWIEAVDIPDLGVMCSPGIQQLPLPIL